MKVTLEEYMNTVTELEQLVAEGILLTERLQQAQKIEYLGIKLSHMQCGGFTKSENQRITKALEAAASFVIDNLYNLQGKLIN